MTVRKCYYVSIVIVYFRVVLYVIKTYAMDLETILPIPIWRVQRSSRGRAMLTLMAV